MRWIGDSPMRQTKRYLIGDCLLQPTTSEAISSLHIDEQPRTANESEHMDKNDY